MLPGRGPGFNTGRARGVLEKVREVSGWGKRKLPARTGMGVAFYYSHLGYFAEVVEVAVANDGQVKINKVWAVGDIGSQVINPTAADNMAHGAILDGLGEALNQKITIENGRVVEANFDTFSPLLRNRRRRSRCISSRPTIRRRGSASRRCRRRSRRCATRSSPPPASGFARCRSIRRC